MPRINIIPPVLRITGRRLRARLPFVAVAVGLLATPNMAVATQTWCATVVSTSDGFLALRRGPSASSTMRAKLPSGTYVELDTAQCQTAFNDDNEPIGDECAKPGWVPVEYASALDDGRPYERVHYAGWVAERYLRQVPCPFDMD